MTRFATTTIATPNAAGTRVFRLIAQELDALIAEEIGRIEAQGRTITGPVSIATFVYPNSDIPGLVGTISHTA